jgi:hypothetical protein
MAFISLYSYPAVNGTTGSILRRLFHKTMFCVPQSLSRAHINILVGSTRLGSLDQINTMSTGSKFECHFMKKFKKWHCMFGCALMLPSCNLNIRAHVQNNGDE